MPLTAGIVGLPNVGKSTLFNAITSSSVIAENYPFATITPNTGIVEVKDYRLNFLTKLFKSAKTIAATFEFRDIAGLVKGASKGEGLGNQFLANIRETDAICHVVRCFENAAIIHVDGSIDPLRDVETIDIELIMADLESVEKRLSRIETKARLQKEGEALIEYNLLSKIKEKLLKMQPARSLPFSEAEASLMRSFQLLTAKPVILIANLGEEDIVNPKANKYYQVLESVAQKEGAELVAICAQVEADIVSLSPEDKDTFLKELGLQESGLDKLTHAAYSLLGLKTFFTVGSKESRAWTFKSGSKAPVCAGIVHSDFERGFIKAEIYSFEDLVKYGSEQAVKDKGRLRIEGKDYIVQDGDIVHFRFNV
ncbi:redox-regulated ATPase YchF [bacterium]|jgi:GTP-binding protein YchF|nr:redox-regulated ATPase YchF [bacterium]